MLQVIFTGNNRVTVTKLGSRKNKTCEFVRCNCTAAVVGKCAEGLAGKMHRRDERWRKRVGTAARTNKVMTPYAYLPSAHIVEIGRCFSICVPYAGAGRCGPLGSAWGCCIRLVRCGPHSTCCYISRLRFFFNTRICASAILNPMRCIVGCGLRWGQVRIEPPAKYLFLKCGPHQWGTRSTLRLSFASTVLCTR